MRFLLFFLLLSISVGQGFAQDSEATKELINRGVALYDQGSYDESLSVFKTVLKDNPQHSIALYEASLCLFQLREYKECADYCDTYLKYTTEENYIGHVMKANALDMMGDKKKAVKAYKTGLKDAPDHFMLCYNLALTLYNMGELDEASIYLQKGIANQPAHASSHLLLSYIEFDRGNQVKSLLAGDYFLLLDRSSERAENVYALMREIKSSGISKNGNEIQILVDSDAGDEDGFNVISTVWAFTKATDGINLEEALDSLMIELVITPESKEANMNAALFSIIAEQQEGKTGFWWEFYAQFYADVNSAEHTETLSYLIMENDPDRDCNEWLSVNGAKVDACVAWLRAYEHE